MTHQMPVLHSGTQRNHWDFSSHVPSNAIWCGIRCKTFWGKSSSWFCLGRPWFLFRISLLFVSNFCLFPGSLGDKNWTQTFFLRLVGHPRHAAKRFGFLGFEGHTELIDPHPFTWETPHPTGRHSDPEVWVCAPFLAWALVGCTQSGSHSAEGRVSAF